MESMYDIAGEYFDMGKRGHDVYWFDGTAADYAYWKKKDDEKLFLIQRILPHDTNVVPYMVMYECGKDRLHPIYSTQGPAADWHTEECACLERLVKLFYPDMPKK